ncbi:hypothetical protein M078_3835 [Bacteroides fragilis str. 2-F-2 |nr:hypothetical protein M078_3835 [Bacteroides fragilis str. 2-F-2 \
MTWQITRTVCKTDIHKIRKNVSRPTKKPVAPLWDVCFPICQLEPETTEMKQ